MIRTANLIASVSRNAGGLFESVRRLVQSLADIGMNVRVIGLLDEFSDQDIRAWLPIWVSALKPTWPENFRYSPMLVEEVMSYRPDVVHNHGLWLYPSVAAYACFRRTRKPYIISPHGMLDPWALANSRWKKVIARALYEERHLQSARCLRALCESEARSIRQCGLKNEIAIIPNGIDLPTELPSEPPPWADAVEPGKKVLLYLGRIHPKKGIPALLRAWADVRPQGSNWVLCVAGWNQGGHEEELKQLLTDQDVGWADVRQKSSRSGASVIFLGPQFNGGKASSYAHCDGFILPSLSEGLPMVALEAWAHSKPVLMTPQCNLPEGFSSGAALSIETNSESVARGLCEFFIMSDSDRSVVGERGRDLVKKRFAWPQISAQMNDVYTWMLGGGPKPACMAGF